MRAEVAVVHYLEPGEKVAPCGYVPARRLLGLDFLRFWGKDAESGLHVNCVTCLLHRPAEWRARRWRGFEGRKRRL